MTTGAEFWVTIALGGLVTYGVRSAFLLFADRLTDVPVAAREVLRMIPAAVLAALAVPVLLRPDGADTALQWVSPELLAGIIAGLVAWRTRNLFATIGTGLVAVMALQAVIG